MLVHAVFADIPVVLFVLLVLCAVLLSLSVPAYYHARNNRMDQTSGSAAFCTLADPATGVGRHILGTAHRCLRRSAAFRLLFFLSEAASEEQCIADPLVLYAQAHLAGAS